jgi:hypothetical protein
MKVGDSWMDRMRRKALEKENVGCGRHSWRKVFENDMTETSGAESFKTENNIIRSRHK